MKNSPKEPIAIVGIGCRFPGGASSPKALWNLLRRGKDAIVDVPADRWDIRRFYDENPDKPGKTYVKQGGFLKEKIDQFDPLFFGISPREAESMDPQQRLLLEVTWEAFENAGIVEEELRGSRTSVFVGGFCLDNMLMRLGQLNRELADAHSAVSSTMTILSNRISYAFDLKGPSVSMDTACSSSLVATHYACQSLWSGEAETAIAGGVNVMLRPEFPIVMSKGKFLSPHGRCKAFDEDAAGYARGEGAGVILLKPLSAAIEHRDTIYALIRETGVNQDGHTAGISLPNSDAQETLAREVYRKAGVSPAAIDYIEAHGTGTQAGDPAELGALHRVLSEGRPADRKCYVGTIKTNIGHLEAAAGVAGIIKAALSLRHETILPNLHFNKPNPKIPFDDLCIQIPTKPQPWKRGERARYAGVNSFGYGGTNAHVLLEEAPAPQATAETEEWSRPYLLPLSARSETALRELAGKYAFYLTANADPKSIADLCYTATQRRSHHSRRLAVAARDADDLRLKLQQFSAGETAEHVSSGSADQSRGPPLAFIYTGMGPQWWAMGRQLMGTEPVFLQALEECDALFHEEAGWSILQELKAEESRSRMAKTEIAQPANFVIQAALTALWKSRGVEPAAIIGHSVGEVASAYASGALSLKDALKVSHHRSRLQQTLAGKGSMLAAGLSETAALDLIAPFDQVSIAAINSPASVTLSGDPRQLAAIAETLAKTERFHRPLDVEVAYHSSQMEAIKEDLLASLASIKPQATHTPLYSTVTGNLIEGQSLTADYWWRNVREPVRFRQGVQALLESGYGDYLEVGPHPVLGHSVKEIAAAAQAAVRVAPSLHRKQPEQLRMLESLGQLHAQGHPIDWPSVTPPGGELIDLPAYPWQKERYWRESPDSLQDRLGSDRHPFLNTRLPTPQPAWTVEINDQFFPYLKDHRVNGQIVFPGAGYVEAGLVLSQEIFGPGPCMLTDLSFEKMLIADPKNVQLICSSYDPKSNTCFIHSKTKDENSEWLLHATGKLIEGTLGLTKKEIDLPALRKKFPKEYSAEELYKMLQSRGLDYGASFRRAKQLWLNENEIFVLISDDPSLSEAGRQAILPPEILDTAFHSLLSIVSGKQPYVPLTIKEIIIRSTIGNVYWYHGTITKRDSVSFTADIQLINDQGEVCIEIKSIYMRLMPGDRTSESREFNQLFYTSKWKEYTPDITIQPIDDSRYLVFSSSHSINKTIDDALSATGRRLLRVTKSGAFRKISDSHIEIDDQEAPDYDRLLSELEKQAVNRIIYAWPCSTDFENPDFEEIVSQCMCLTSLIQAIGKRASFNSKITIVTKGAQAVDGSENLSGLNASPLWGFGPLLENEYSNISCGLIDLDPSESNSHLLNWPDLLSNADQRDIAIRGSKFYEKKIERTAIDKHSLQEDIKSVSTEEPLELTQSASGQIESFYYRPTKRIPPEPDEVEIKVHSSCLNFKDVLKAYGTLPASVTNDTYFGRSIGLEASGTVVRVGSNPTCYNVGDRIVVPALGSFRSYITTPVKWTKRIPDNVSFEDFFIYVGYLASYYGLVEIARLQKGEKVLIHSATGGFGLAAIQIAKWLGAEIFATAGTHEKRDYLKSIGIQHVMDSRSLEFESRIRKLTDGKGVDVVLNALSGDALRRSLSLLAPYGRFIEVGKRDISINAGLPMAAFNENLTFSSVDIDRLYSEKPELVEKLLEEIRSGFEKGFLSKMPKVIFPANKTKDAFQYLAQYKHIGKVIVNFSNENLDVSTTQSKNSRPGSFLVTGGNSGFGLQVAKWLHAKESKRIVLISRNGANSDEAQSTIQELKDAGANISSEAIDITQKNLLIDLFKRLEQEGTPVRGIIHGAMVLDDCFIKDLTKERLRSVMAPKILGALNLFAATQQFKVDYFVSFSSISSLIGNRGQASYVVANAFLDAFSPMLAQQGMPTTTINWGALSEAGVVSRNHTIGKLLEQEGIIGLTNELALKALSSALSSRLGQIGVFNIDWGKWGEANSRAASSFRFSDLVAEHRSGGRENEMHHITEAISNLGKTEQHEHLEQIAKNGLSQVLKIPPEKIDSRQTLNDLGIDSLLLIELSLIIQSEFGISIPAAELPKYPTIYDLVDNILNRILNSRKNRAA